MADPILAPTRALFPFLRWSSELPSLRRRFRHNQPCPHIHLEEFLDLEVAIALAREFPDMATDAWTRYKHQNENKLGLAKRSLFPSLLGEVVDELNSPEFVRWLSELTGIPNLVSDDMLEGGGLHQSGAGGFLNVHTDFSNHHYHKHWRRQINLILYLNPDWDEKWGGALELWDREMRRCVTRVPEISAIDGVETACPREVHPANSRDPARLRVLICQFQMIGPVEQVLQGRLGGS